MQTWTPIIITHTAIAVAAMRLDALVLAGIFTLMPGRLISRILWA
jgi:uncharacterized membrane protein